MMLLRMNLKCFHCPDLATESRPICTRVQEGDQKYLLWMGEFHGGKVPVFSEREAQALMRKKGWRDVPFRCFANQQRMAQVLNDMVMRDIACIEVSNEYVACQTHAHPRGDQSDI